MLYCGQNKERLSFTKSESVYIEHLDKIIPLLVKKLRSNELEFRKYLYDSFSNKKDIEVIQSQMDEIDSQINDLNSQLDDISEESISDAYVALKGQIQREINELISQKNVLNNKKITIANPEKRVQLIIDELRKFPKDDSIGDYDFRKLFKKVIIINRDRLIFVIGSDDMSKIPYNPNSIPMSFIESMQYKFRSRTFTTQFGILVNK